MLQYSYSYRTRQMSLLIFSTLNDALSLVTLCELSEHCDLGKIAEVSWFPKFRDRVRDRTQAAIQTRAIV
jgi:hypothetical protein